MVLNALGISEIRKSEGKRLNAYWDVNGYAIGYGQHYYSDGRKVQRYDTISEHDLEIEFPKILNQYSNDVKRVLKVSLNDNQFSALVCYTYNRGGGAFQKSRLLQMVNSNPNNSEIPAQFVIEWGTNQNDKTALIKRRAREAKIWQTKDSPFDATKLLYFALLILLGYLIYKYFAGEPEVPPVKKQKLLLS
jgi:lysozyme